MATALLPRDQPTPSLAVVTGAASGINLDISRVLIENDIRVLGVDVNGDGLKEAADLFGTAFIPHVCDLRDRQAIADLAHVREVREADVLVNGAGRLVPAEQHETKDQDVIDGLMIMLYAPMILGRHVLPGMYERGFGRIINLASIYGMFGGWGKGEYSAAKHGLVGWTECLAQECAGTGVAVSCVSPAHADTPLFDQQFVDEAVKAGQTTPQRGAVLRGQIPGHVAVQTWEIAALVHWLATDAPPCMNGSIINADFGWTRGVQRNTTSLDVLRTLSPADIKGVLASVGVTAEVTGVAAR